MKIIDQHVHTEFSIDSKVDIEEYFKLAKKNELDYVSFTDHVDYDSLDYGGLDVFIEYDRLKHKGLKLQEKYDVKLNLGVEMGYRIDLEDSIESYLSDKDFDVILFSVHQDKAGHYATDSRTDQERIEAYFQALHHLLDSKFDFDIITHIDYVFRYLKNKKAFLDLSDVYDEILAKIIEKNVILEINTKSRLIIGDYSFVEFILEKYSKLGGQHISLGSDCHHISRYQEGFEEVIAIMKRNGLNFVTEVIKRKRRFKSI